MADNSAGAASTPATTPIEAPLPDCKPLPQPELTAEQERKYDALLKSVQGFSEVQCAKEPAKSGSITETEQEWLTKDCLLRYLRATKWNVDEASKRLASTLVWRREYGLYDFTADYISPEQETGKELLLGFDKLGQPCQYMTPGRQNTDVSPRQIHHLFFIIERTVDLMPPGVEKMSLMINFKPTKKRQNTSVGISTAREVLHILQHHYPERLGKALIINVPWVVWGFFKLINPFMDPVTREKMKFNEDMKSYVPSAQLWSEDWGGDLNFDYDHSIYWPKLIKLCEQRAKSRHDRWVAAGKLIGESEEYLTGGKNVSVSGFEFKSGEAVDKADMSSIQALEEKVQEVKLDNAAAVDEAKV